MRVLFLIILLVFVITACNPITDKNPLDNLNSPHPDFYMLYAIADKDKYFKDINELLDHYTVDYNQLLSIDSKETLYYFSYLWLYNGNKKFEFVKSLNLVEYPTFLVFNSEQMVFLSTNIKEVDIFLSTREETEGIKQRRKLRQEN